MNNKNCSARKSAGHVVEGWQRDQGRHLQDQDRRGRGREVEHFTLTASSSRCGPST